MFHSFSKTQDVPTAEEARDKEDDEAQAYANRLVQLARLIPALKTLNEKIGELNAGAVEGVALVSEDKPDVITTNGRGLVILKTRELANELIELWKRNAEQYEDEIFTKRAEVPKILVRRVKVSMEKGVEFLD